MSRQNTDFWVGLFVLLGIAGLVFLALQVGNLSALSFSRTYEVTANFNDIGSLKERAPIKSAGVSVGRVNRIGFDNQTFQAIVTLSLDTGYLFPKDSSASIQTTGLLGEQYIGLMAGSDDKVLADGDNIQFTQDAVVLESLISKFLYNTAAKQGTSAAAPH
jgi:phospholipid/cholesterol/gamma-HCH transport system substrate-binding protein